MEIQARQITSIETLRGVVVLTDIGAGATARYGLGGAAFRSQHALVHVENDDETTEEDRTDDGALY